MLELRLHHLAFTLERITSSDLPELGCIGSVDMWMFQGTDMDSEEVVHCLVGTPAAGKGFVFRHQEVLGYYGMEQRQYLDDEPAVAAGSEQIRAALAELMFLP